MMEKYKCKEVFIVAGDEDQDIGEIFITETWDDLDAHLKTFTPDVHSGTRVFHGVLTPAEFLPDRMFGKSAFILVVDPDDPQKGAIVEASCETPDEMGEDITQTLEFGTIHMFDSPIEIKDIFILYGYQLQTCICVDEDELDEEVIEACEMIGTQVEETACAVSLRNNNVGG